MSKFLLAVAIAVSFVAVQGHVQRVKSFGAAARLAGSGQPTSPLPAVSLGLGTTRAIEKGRHFAQLDMCVGSTLLVVPLAAEATGSSPAAVPVAPRDTAPLNLRI